MKVIDINKIGLENIDVNLLPESMKNLISHIGLKPTLILMENYGGRLPCVPTKPTRGHKLDKLLGWKAFCILSEIVGGDKSFYIPKLDKVISQIKQQLAQHMAHHEGLSADRIAQELDISHRHAQRIKNNHTAKPPLNLDLFR